MLRYYRSSVVICMVFLIGCQEAGKQNPPFNIAPGESGVVGRVIPYPHQEDYEATFRLRLSLQDQTDRNSEAVANEILSILDTGDPYLANGLMNDVLGWISREDNVEYVLQFARKCLDSPDSLMRWVGIRTAYFLGEHDLAWEILEKDYRSVLIRPDPVPWYAVPFWRREAKRVARREPAYMVALLRRDIIDFIGRYQIQPAREVLLAILSDPYEWHEETKEWTQSSLDMLEEPKQSKDPSLESSP